MTDYHPDDDIRALAAEWFIRLQNSEDEQDWLAHREWLEGDLRHAQVYADIEALWVDLDGLAVATPNRANDSLERHESAAPSAEVIDLSQHRSSRWHRLAWAPAIAAAAAVAAFVVVPLVGPRAPVLGQTYRTGPNEIRRITLADGSQLTLNRASQVVVRLDRHDRRADLTTGEVSFDIHHEADRQFRVIAANREIRVLGTEFNVVNESGAVSVTVRRGVVSVALRDNADGAIRVPAGRAFRHLPATSVDTVTPVSPDDAFAWQKGQLVYTDRPLTEVAIDLSRYMHKPIHVSPALQQTRLTGAFTVGDAKMLRRQLELALPVKFIDDADGTTDIVPSGKR
jgi:transmembrane sensor